MRSPKLSRAPMTAAALTMAVVVVAAAVLEANAYGSDIPTPVGRGFAGHATKAQDTKMKVDGKWFVDGQGRVRFFHGINQVRKSFPWYPDSLFNDTFVENVRDWGFNVVRLGTMWSGLEIGSYQYNETYLAVIKTLVERLSSNGIYVIFDMHQDGLSSAFGLYDGMPLWLLKQLSPSLHGFPWPFNQISSWFETYLTEACSHAFQQLYNNEANAVDHLRGFWRTLAAAFADNPFVLGYELINEPWAGNIYADPLLLLPGEAGSRNLMPLYDSLNDAIRQVDNDTIVFYEPVTWGVTLNGKTSGTGFDRVPGGYAYSNRSALAYHYYCWLLNQENGGPPDSPVKRAICDDVMMPLVFDSVLKDINATGGAAFLTEFGICTPAANDTHYSSPCEPVVGAAYTYLQSWTYWDSTFYDEQGHVMWNVVELYSRPYAQAVAGMPLEMTYNATTGSFSLTYECGTGSLRQPDRESDGDDDEDDDPPLTEIYASTLHYPHGYKVVASPGLRWYQDGNKLYVQKSPAYTGQYDVCFVGLVRINVPRRKGGASGTGHRP